MALQTGSWHTRINQSGNASNIYSYNHFTKEMKVKIKNTKCWRGIRGTKGPVCLLLWSSTLRVVNAFVNWGKYSQVYELRSDMIKDQVVSPFYCVAVLGQATANEWWQTISSPPSDSSKEKRLVQGCRRDSRKNFLTSLYVPVEFVGLPYSESV